MKIVLLPGLDGTGRLFEPFVAALPQGFDPQIVSYPSSSSLGYEELVTYVISKLPDQDFVLVGESFSGYIAYRVALTKPKFLKSVIFVASFLETPRPYLLNLSKLLPRKKLLSIPIPIFIARAFLFGNEVENNLIILFRQALTTVSTDVLLLRLEAISKLPTSDEACQTKAIYIQAENDKLIPPDSVDRFKDLFDNIEVHKITGPHFLMQCNPEACAEIVAGAYAS